MIRFTEEQLKAVSSLKMNHNFLKLVKVLAEEQDFCTTGLRKAKADTFAVLQGRSQILEELLSVFQDSH